MSFLSFFNRGKACLCLPKVLWTCIVLWISFQIIFVSVYHYGSDYLENDPGWYVYYAMECIKHGTMFPDYSNYYSEYIFSPGWINFIILWIKLFGSIRLIPYFCILLNVAILYLLYKISLKVTESKNITFLALYLFMFLPANSTIVLHLYTEIPFEALSLFSFYLIFSQKSRMILLAGICIALAQWIRPLGVAWMLAAVFFMLYKDKRIKHAIIYVTGIVCTCGCIGIATHRNFPTYVFQSVTGGVNLIMGANDMATGGYIQEARYSPEGLGYLPGLFKENEFTTVRLGDGSFRAKYSNKYTYLECDSIYKARAIQWIKNNPTRWCALIPIKTVKLFNTALTYVSTPYASVNESPVFKMLSLVCRIAGRFFIIIVLLAFAGLFTPFWNNKKLIYTVIPVVVCTAMTVAVFGNPRFNFIMLPFIIIFACVSLKYYKNKVIK